MRDIIYLVSTANTGFFYTTTKNTKGQKPKIETKKYDPIAKKHVVFKESKKPSAKKRVVVKDSKKDSKKASKKKNEG